MTNEEVIKLKEDIKRISDNPLFNMSDIELKEQMSGGGR
jgi:hypothetical protein